MGVMLNQVQTMAIVMALLSATIALSDKAVNSPLMDPVKTTIGNPSTSDWNVCGPHGCAPVDQICGTWGCAQTKHICPSSGCGTPDDRSNGTFGDASAFGDAQMPFQNVNLTADGTPIEKPFNGPQGIDHPDGTPFGGIICTEGRCPVNVGPHQPGGTPFPGTICTGRKQFVTQPVDGTPTANPSHGTRVVDQLDGTPVGGPICTKRNCRIVGIPIDGTGDISWNLCGPRGCVPIDDYFEDSDGDSDVQEPSYGAKDEL